MQPIDPHGDPRTPAELEDVPAPELPGTGPGASLTDRVTASTRPPAWLGNVATPRPRGTGNPNRNPNPNPNPRPEGGSMDQLKVLETASVGAPIRRGGLALYPVYLHGDEPLAIEVDRGVLEVAEHGSATVPSVSVVNRAELPALLVEGETIKGGLQDRSVNVSILVPGRGRVQVPVTCIERGRWGGRASGFSRHHSFAPRRVRRTKTASVGEAFAAEGQRLSDQGAVWGSVEDELDRLAAYSPSRSMLDGERRVEAELGHVADELAAVGPLPGQRGVVVGVGSRIVSADLFASTELLAANWEALVRGYLADAVGQRQAPAQPGAALRFLHRLAGLRGREGAGVGLGTELHLRGRGVVGQVLSHEGKLVHASAYAAVA